MIGRFCLLLFVFILSIIFLYSIFFPESILRYGYKNVDPLFRIAEPTMIHKNTLTWSGALTDATDSITISITADKSLTDATLTLKKGFLAHLNSTTAIGDFPKARFDSTLPFSPGTLITGTRGHAVTSLMGERHPIDSVLTLQALGYTFDESQDTANDEWSMYSKGALLTIRSPHPSGTIFHEEDTDHTYLYTGQSLTPIQPTEEQSIVTVRSTSRVPYENCTFVKKHLSRDTYTCTIPVSDLQSNPGKDYLFTLESARDTNVSHITLTFTPEKSIINLRNRISSVREILKK